tara:strand:- start:8 stop:1627 length:1620 start_codon:yes stop_codon:yes gene_type:complete
MAGLVVIIPAFTQDTPPQRDVMRKLGGASLIQRAIAKSRELIDEGTDQIYVLTDSELVALTAERAGAKIHVLTDDSNTKDAIEVWRRVIVKTPRFSDSHVLVLSPFAPLVKKSTFEVAREALTHSNASVVSMTQKYLAVDSPPDRLCLSTALLRHDHHETPIRTNAFTLFDASCLRSASEELFSSLYLPGGDDLFEIRSYQDWWVCEKLLLRRRIVFRVIGNRQLGMGHIYRALSLAHEITDHEIIFVTEADHHHAVSELADHDYRLEVYSPDSISDDLIRLEPDLVVNDILDTSADYVSALRDAEIQVVNFEDLGPGALIASATFNELYDRPQIDGDNLYWGNSYFFVRDEFAEASPCPYRDTPRSLLLTFGGTDQHDLTQKLLEVVSTPCREHNVHISIVTGPGYNHYDQLKADIAGEPNISLTHATGVISKIMENADIAITSNGRTVYEMAHMNIPAIVVPQHQREKTHSFACEENGFIALEAYCEGNTERAVLSSLEKLLNDSAYRKTLFDRVSKFDFSQNKRRVINIIEELLTE